MIVTRLTSFSTRGDEVLDADTERVRQAVEDLKVNTLVLTGFDAGNSSLIRTCGMGQLLLGEASLSPQPAHIATQKLHQIHRCRRPDVAALFCPLIVSFSPV